MPSRKKTSHSKISNPGKINQNEARTCNKINPHWASGRTRVIASKDLNFGATISLYLVFFFVASRFTNQGEGLNVVYGKKAKTFVQELRQSYTTARGLLEDCSLFFEFITLSITMNAGEWKQYTVFPVTCSLIQPTGKLRHVLSWPVKLGSLSVHIQRLSSIISCTDGHAQITYLPSENEIWDSLQLRLTTTGPWSLWNAINVLQLRGRLSRFLASTSILSLVQYLFKSD